MTTKASYKDLLLLGLVCGTWLAFSCDTFCAFILVTVAVLALKRLVPGDDYAFIAKMVFCVFVARFIFIFLYYRYFLHPGHMDLFGPDGEIYIQRGWYISRLMLGVNPYSVPNTSEFIFRTYFTLPDFFEGRYPPAGSYQVGLSPYLFGVVFSIFGYVPILIKLINSLIGILAGVIVYLIAREMFNRKIAKASFVLFLLWPSIFLFSATVLKEPLLLLFISLAIYSLILYSKKKNIGTLISFLIAVYIIHLVRPQLTMPFLASGAVSVFMVLSARNWRKAVLLAAACFIAGILFYARIRNFFHPETLFSRHMGYIWTPGNNYKFLPEIRYSISELPHMSGLEMVAAFFNSIIHFVFEPFPSKVDSPMKFFAFSQNVIFIILLPFSFVGLAVGLRHRIKQMVPIVIYMALLISAMSICEGNIGTVFRHRLIFMPFWIILACVGIYRVVLRSNPISEQ